MSNGQTPGQGQMSTLDRVWMAARSDVAGMIKREYPVIASDVAVHIADVALEGVQGEIQLLRWLHAEAVWRSRQEWAGPSQASYDRVCNAMEKHCARADKAESERDELAGTLDATGLILLAALDLDGNEGRKVDDLAEAVCDRLERERIDAARWRKDSEGHAAKVLMLRDQLDRVATAVADVANLLPVPPSRVQGFRRVFTVGAVEPQETGLTVATPSGNQWIFDPQPGGRNWRSLGPSPARSTWVGLLRVSKVLTEVRT